MSVIDKIKKILKRNLTHRAGWRDLRSVEPVSRYFGCDRGTPVDRYYIEKFLQKNASAIKGSVLEVADSHYSKKFGTAVRAYEVLHVDASNPSATIVGDLSRPDTLPEGCVDCFICTQTFNFIYDFKAAIAGARRVLKPGGVLLATLAGVSQISRYDMDRWGDYWRFTTASAKRAFGEVFGDGAVEVESFGNVLAAVALLEGISAEELTRPELERADADYQVIITVKASRGPLTDERA